jgi:L-ascorbate metabolism protein UlaG (beta-lactamase superfamily)
MWKADGLIIEAVAAYNFTRFRSPGVPYHPRGIQIGFIVAADGKRVYHVGDTDLIPEMHAIHDTQLFKEQVEAQSDVQALVLADGDMVDPGSDS